MQNFYLKNFNQFLLIINKSYYHPKFRDAVFKRQQRILDKFENEINDTMQRIKTNQKIKIKRKKSSLSTTTKTLMMMNSQNNNTMFQNEWNYPSGSPEQLVIKRDGLQQSFITNRMRILNTNFLRATAEIFATDEQLSKLMNELKFRITDVRISKDYKYLQIYWWSNDESVDNRQEIGTILNNNKGRLHEMLTEMQYTRNVPWIQFVFDIKASYEQELDRKLELCRKELETVNKVNNLNDNYSLKDRISTLNTSFNHNIDDVKKLNYQTHANEYDHMEMPADMFRKIVPDLDYEKLMNKVLKNMPRSRAQQQQDLIQMKTLNECNTNDENLNNLKQSSINNHQQQQTIVDYDTDNRIKAIRKFVQLNRKRKDKMEKRLKLLILSEEIDRFDNYENLKQCLEQRYDELINNQTDYHYDDNDDDKLSSLS